jgi:hypothetical protein
MLTNILHISILIQIKKKNFEGKKYTKTKEKETKLSSISSQSPSPIPVTFQMDSPSFLVDVM